MVANTVLWQTKSKAQTLSGNNVFRRRSRSWHQNGNRHMLLDVKPKCLAKTSHGPFSVQHATLKLCMHQNDIMLQLCGVLAHFKPRVDVINQPGMGNLIIPKRRQKSISSAILTRIKLTQLRSIPMPTISTSMPHTTIAARHDDWIVIHWAHSSVTRGFLSHPFQDAHRLGVEKAIASDLILP